MALRFLGFLAVVVLMLPTAMVAALVSSNGCGSWSSYDSSRSRNNCRGAGITLLVSLVVAVAIAVLTEFNPSAWITCNIATSYH